MELDQRSLSPVNRDLLTLAFVPNSTTVGYDNLKLTHLKGKWSPKNDPPPGPSLGSQPVAWKRSFSSWSAASRWVRWWRISVMVSLANAWRHICNHLD